MGEGRMKNQGFGDPKGTAPRLHLPTDKGEQKCLKNLLELTLLQQPQEGQEHLTGKSTHLYYLSPLVQTAMQTMSTRHQCWKRGQKEAAGALRSHITFSWKSELSLEDK